MENMDLYKIGEEVLIGARVESRKFDNNGNVVYSVSIKGTRGDFPYTFEHDMLFPMRKNTKIEVKNDEKVEEKRSTKNVTKKS